MSYYNQCPYCKANLDPGERCDCLKDKEKRDDNKMIKTDHKAGVRIEFLRKA